MLDFWHVSGAFKLLLTLDDLRDGIFVGQSAGAPPAAEIFARAVLWILEDLRVGIFAGDLVGTPPVDFWLGFWWDFWVGLEGGGIKGR